MKKQAQRTTKKRPKPKLPAPLSGLALEDLAWDTASPLAALVFEDIQQEQPAPAFWATVSGLAVFYESDRLAETAGAAYASTSAPVLKRLREAEWRNRQSVAKQNAILLWAAVLDKLTAMYPEASDGQRWVLVRDALRALRDEYYLVYCDGR